MAKNKDKPKPAPAPAAAPAESDFLSDLKFWSGIELLKYLGRKLLTSFFRGHQDIAASRIGHMFVGPPKEAIQFHERAQTDLFSPEQTKANSRLAAISKRYTKRLAPVPGGMPRELSNLYREYFAILPPKDKLDDAKEVEKALEATKQIIWRHANMDDEEWQNLRASHDLDREIVPDPVGLKETYEREIAVLQSYRTILKWVLMGVGIVGLVVFCAMCVLSVVAAALVSLTANGGN
ncbi:MAG: hypothetical protein KW788_03165 [Candidatus Doudnabacteria bacterium]|nr:hypothetical protein [Candidatus Doudnabacteria bacterium]